MAIIGIYYFKDGDNLRKELKYLMDHNIVVNGEYQLTDALENMKNNGVKFVPGEIKEWMDCGNKDATVHTNQRILEYHKNDDLISKTAIIENSIIIPPCYIGENVSIKDAIIGPHVSIGKESKIEKAIVSNSIIQQHASLKSITITNSMIGNYAYVKDVTVEINVGDFTQIDFDTK
jgi:glucose-1-phosphate thymidylyltransferase